MECVDARTELAAQALGNEEPAPDTPLTRHLHTCPDCRAEQEDNTRLLALLATVAPHELDGIPTPDPDAAIARLHHEHTTPAPTPTPAPAPAGTARRRTGFALAAAVAGIVLAGTGFLTGRTMNTTADGPPPTHDTLHTTSGHNTGTGTTADIQMRSTTWGTEFQLTLRGLTGPQTCVLIAVTTTGTTTRIADWTVPPTGYGTPHSPDPLHLTASNALTTTDITHLRITTDTGQPLLDIPT